MTKYLSLTFAFIAVYLTAKNANATRSVRDVSNAAHQTNGRVSDYATRALGSFKRFMKQGNSDLGIPVLDPVQMESFNYSLANSPVGFRMDIQFQGPILMGLSNYELMSASELRNSQENKLLMTIVFPTIQVKGTYSADGNLFGLFSLGGQGDFNIVGSSQVLSAEANLVVLNETLVVQDITSQFVGGRVKAQFTDNISSGPFAGILSEFLSAMGQQVFDKKLKPVVTIAMNDYTKEWLNGAFSSVNLNELLGYQSPQVQVQQNGGPHDGIPRLQVQQN